MQANKNNPNPHRTTIKGMSKMIKENLNICEAQSEFNKWLLESTEDYMNKKNARFHIISSEVGLFQVVLR